MKRFLIVLLAVVCMTACGNGSSVVDDVIAPVDSPSPALDGGVNTDVTLPSDTVHDAGVPDDQPTVTADTGTPFLCPDMLCFAQYVYDYEGNSGTMGNRCERAGTVLPIRVDLGGIGFPPGFITCQGTDCSATMTGTNGMFRRVLRYTVIPGGACDHCAAVQDFTMDWTPMTRNTGVRQICRQ